MAKNGCDHRNFPEGYLCDFCTRCVCGHRADEHTCANGGCFLCSCLKLEEKAIYVTFVQKEKNMKTLVLDKENPLATKVQTRDGRKARLLAVDLKSHSHKFPIVAAVLQSDGTEYIEIFYEDGRKYQANDSGYDIVNTPVTHEVWMNCYPRSGDGKQSDIGWSTRKEADAGAAPTRIARLHVTFVEGQFDE